MDVHPTKNGINRYWSIPILSRVTATHLPTNIPRPAHPWPPAPHRSRSHRCSGCGEPTRRRRRSQGSSRESPGKERWDLGTWLGFWWFLDWVFVMVGNRHIMIYPITDRIIKESRRAKTWRGNIKGWNSIYSSLNLNTSWINPDKVLELKSHTWVWVLRRLGWIEGPQPTSVCYGYHGSHNLIQGAFPVSKRSCKAFMVG